MSTPELPPPVTPPASRHLLRTWFLLGHRPAARGSPYHRHPAVEGFVQGLGLAVVGILLVALYSILQSAGVAARSLTLLNVALGLAQSQRVPVVGIVGLASLAGVL